MSQLSVASLVVEDRDGGGGVQQALYSEAQNKKVFVLKETMENRTFLWPRKFKEPVIISNACTTGNVVKRALQIKKVFDNSIEKPVEKTAETKTAKAKKGTSKTDSKKTLQPELF